MAYDNTNSGVLFKNDDKQEENHPDYKGSINVNGEEFWLAAWIKEGKEGGKMEGRKFISMSLKPKEERQAKPAKKSPQRGGNNFADVDDDIPW